MIHQDLKNLFAEARFRADFQPIGQSAVDAARLVIDKALASITNATAFPLPPDPHAIERVIVRKLSGVSSEALTKASKDAVRRLQASPAKKKRYGHFAAVAANDLALPARDLLRKHAPPPARAAATRVVPRIADPRFRQFQPSFLSPPVGLLRSASPEKTARRPLRRPALEEPTPLRIVDSLELRLNRLTCHKPTRGPGKDDIYMAARCHNLYTATDTSVAPFMVGKFKKEGDVLQIGKTLATYDVPDNLAFDSVFLATIYLAEADLGKGFEKYVASTGSVSSHEFYELVIGTAAFAAAMWLEEKMPTTDLSDLPLLMSTGSGFLAAVSMGMIGTREAVAMAALIPVVLAALVAIVGTTLFDAIRSLLGDEVFPPCLGHIHLEGPSALAPPTATKAQKLLFALRQEKSPEVVYLNPDDPTAVKVAKADAANLALYEAELEWTIHTKVSDLKLEDLEPAKPLQNEADALRALSKIKHIAVVMLENRSFDQMLGFLARDRQRADADPLAGPGKPPEINMLGDRQFTPQHLESPQFLMDPAHSVQRVGLQMWGPDFWLGPVNVDGQRDGGWAKDHVHEGPDRGDKIDDASEIEFPDSFEGAVPMGGFVHDFARTINGHRSHVDPGNSVDEQHPTPLDITDVGPVMGYHPAEHVPVYDFLATEFGICNRWFCAFPGNTWVNRTLAYTGKPATRIFGQDANGKPLVVDNDMPIDEPSFVRVLENKKVDWAWYAQDVPSVLMVDLSLAGQLPEGRLRSLDRFFRDLQKPTFPSVSWIDPNFVDMGSMGSNVAAVGPAELLDLNTANDDHPPTDVTHGQNFIYEVFKAIQESPHWDSTLLIITYDEHGGFYDHVPPPRLADGLETGTPFKWHGPRVPALVISPHVGRQLVFSQAPSSGTPAKVVDHMSILKTVFLRFCREADGSVQYPSPRVEAAEHLGWVLSGENLRFGPGKSSRSGKLRSDLTNRVLRRVLAYRKLKDKLRTQGVRRRPTELQDLVFAKRGHIEAKRNKLAPRQGRSMNVDSAIKAPDSD